jgi:hypothetical protein
MSWDDNLAALLQNYKNIDQIAFSSQTGELYGSSHRSVLNPTQSEMVAAYNAAKDPNTKESKVTIGGQNFIILRRIDDMIISKCQKLVALVVNSPKMTLVAICDESQVQKSGKGVDELFKIRDYYASVGY